MKRIKVITVLGTRPEIIRLSCVMKALDSHTEHLVVHTGQNYDYELNEVFFQDLELPQPDAYLGVGSGTHAEQTARIMIEFEKVIDQQNPDLVIVVGDVNSTAACSLVATKKGVKVAHIEAGLRSFDRTMPEEINRIVTDALSDYLFVTEKSGLENLKRIKTQCHRLILFYFLRQYGKYRHFALYT